VQPCAQWRRSDGAAPFLAAAAIREKRLMPLLPQYPLPEWSINLLYPPHRHPSTIVRTYLDSARAISQRSFKPAKSALRDERAGLNPGERRLSAAERPLAGSPPVAFMSSRPSSMVDTENIRTVVRRNCSSNQRLQDPSQVASRRDMGPAHLSTPAHRHSGRDIRHLAAQARHHLRQT
jgi:hypothetical protein